MLEFESDEEVIKFVLAAKLPEWKKQLYKRNADAIQVHSQGQLFYKIDRLFPNEEASSKEHRLLAFESITEPSFGRAANNVNRIFKNSSYTVEASENTLDLLNQHNFDGFNFYTWFLDNWAVMSLKEDANALFAVYPPEYVAKGNPWVQFISSEHILLDNEDACVFISVAESDVKYELSEICIQTERFYDQSIRRANVIETAKNTFAPKITSQIKKKVIHAFIKGLGFYKIEETGNKGENGGKEYFLTFFPIEQDFIPVTDVGGERDKMQVNKSFLWPFVPFGNLALLQHSQHCAVNFTFSFPRMSEVVGPCDNPICKSGKVDVEIDDEHPDGLAKCQTCKGTGRKSVQSPYKVYQKVIDPSGLEGNPEELKYPMVEYYTPPTAILEYSKKEWKDYLDQAETAVYIQQRVKTGMVEAAKSKEIDRDDLYSFLSRVGQVFFSRMRFAVQCFENYLNARPVAVTVNNPYSYAILSEGEAFTELKDILNSTVPVPIKANRVESFINKFVSASSPIKKFLDILKLVDPLLYYTPAEITGYKVAGVVSADAVATHVFSYPILQSMYAADKNLFLQDNKAIVDKLTKELEKYKPQPQEDLATKLKGTKPANA